MTSAPITVIVVDDDPMVRRLMTEILCSSGDIEVIAALEDGDQVVAAVAARRPDVLLMDLRMKRMGGLEATAAVAALPDPPRVIVMTSMDVDDAVLGAIVAGAHSFLVKTEAPETWIHSVRVVAGGITVFDPEALRQITAAAPAALPHPAIGQLTERERQALVLLARGLANKAIALQMHISETTAKTHITALLQKLGAANRVEAALHAYRAGLVS